MEGDIRSGTPSFPGLVFLSTPSGWRATEQILGRPLLPGISIHALRVEGDLCTSRLPVNVRAISIHALRVEGDAISRSPSYPLLISIHALRVEGDEAWRKFYCSSPNFYPRPPGGGRLDVAIDNWHRARISIHALRVEGDRCCPFMLRSCAKFLSTPSGWRATIMPLKLRDITQISIHALRVEGDAGT